MNILHGLFDLTGCTALITGGSRGLGLQIAEALGEYGASIAISARKQDELDAAVSHLTANGIAARAYAADLRTPQAAEALVAAVMQDAGKIDILVNNAGATWGAAAEDHTPANWRRVMDINVDGLFYVTQAVGRASMLPRRSGRILNVASIAGLKAHHHEGTGTIAYNTSKGAVVMLTKALAAEWAKHGITVNAIAPGWFPSKMTSGVLAEHGADFAARTPLGKLGGPDDLKGAALLFTSAAGGHITGQILAIDGGASII